MRIFVLLSRIPYPLEKGDKLRAFYQIKMLSQQHEIILCALNTLPRSDKQKAFESLQPYCRSVNFIDLPLTGRILNVVKAYFSGLPLQVGLFFNKKAAKKIRLLIEEYKPDHLYGQLVRTAPYLMNRPETKTLDYQDAFAYGLKRRTERSLFPLKTLLKLEYKQLSRFEKKAFDHFDIKTIISEQDREWIGHPEKSKILIIKNGVDLDFFKPGSESKEFDIVFTGNMHYPPNVDAAQFLIREIMPIVWNQRPQTTVLIAGASPHRKVLRLRSSRVTISGWLSDIRTAYNSGKIFIAPMRLGTGLQNKLLEAMAMQVPAITTSVANASLMAQDSKEVLIGESAQELAERILMLIDNKMLQQNLTENADRLLRKNYRWEACTAKLEKSMNELYKTQMTVKDV
ncbi:MAG: glycosyltransferase [Bacteroidales bacterium]|nr:glycosyltransferase [Bacteroidales bacterium]